MEVRRDGTVEVAPAKEVRSFGDRDFVLEDAIICDFGLVRAWKGDRHPDAAAAGRRQAHREEDRAMSTRWSSEAFRWSSRVSASEPASRPGGVSGVPGL